MSYKKTGDGNGRVYIGVVKWGHDNSDIMLFNSESERNKFFEDNFDLIKTNNIFINENKFVDIKETIEDISNYNYLFYYNDSDITSKPRCCFINSYEYIAPNTTRIYVELDVIQQFIYQTDFYQSYVVRGTVKKSADTVGAYTQNEPFSVKLEYESLKSDVLTVSEWAPTWVLHATSKFITSDDTYHYEGTGTDNTFGEYGFYINSANHLKNYIERYGRKSLNDIFNDAGIEVSWKDLLAALVSGGTSPSSMSAFSVDFGASVAELQDHRNELIGLYAIPTWARGSGSEATNNRTTIQSAAITLNNQTLANGYTPRNKKMLTSICRAYVLLNRTGLQIALKPELFTANSTYIGLGCIPMCTSGYQYFIANYANAAASYGEVPYTSERRVGFDQNTGLNKVLSYINAASNVAGAVGSVASAAATENPVAIIQSAAGLAQAGISAVDQIGSKGGGFGNNGDLMRVTGFYSQLHFYELNPSVNESRALDDFFDKFGYAINEIYDIDNENAPVYFKSRSAWNYIQTRDINCNCHCPTEYEDKFKAVFNSGVTIWHTYEHFCNYSQANNDV